MAVECLAGRKAQRRERKRRQQAFSHTCYSSLKNFEDGAISRSVTARLLVQSGEAVATFLLTFNSERSSIEAWKRAHRRSSRGKTVNWNWSTRSHRQMSSGDYVYFSKQGVQPRGIFASGIVTSEPFEGFWDDAKEGLRPSWFVDVEIDLILDPEQPLALTPEQLERKFPSVHWWPRASGPRLPDDVADRLDQLWAEVSGGKLSSLRATNTVRAAVEGIAEEHQILIRSRNRSIRDARIEQVKRRNRGALPCEVPSCGFDFQRTYGTLGRDYAHVHHLTPLSESKVTITTTKDLRVVCANCHMMLHRSPRPEFSSLGKRRSTRKDTR